MQFKDHFSKVSQGYQQYRPVYPPALFSYLASICNPKHTAWDCATGTGQSALMLADYFEQVIATDASAQQISNAKTKQGVHYRLANAEHSGLDSNAADLITVAQALHWFDIDAFAKETVRVLKDGGVIAVWSYNLLGITPQIDDLVRHLYAEILRGYWPAERAIVESGYRDISLPLMEINAPTFEMTAQWSLSELVGYLCTWSASQRYQSARGINPVEIIYADLAAAWSKQPKRDIRWPLNMRIWQK